MRILFNSKDKKYKSVFGTLRENEGCTLNIHIPKSCKTCDVRLIFNREDGKKYCEYSMFKTSEYEGYEVYSCDVCFACAELFFYYFVIKTENEEFSLYKWEYDMTNMEEGDYWQLSVIPKDFSVPERFKGNVMYQIFPDRFNKDGMCIANGKLTPFWIHSDLTDVPHFLPDEKGIVQNNDFFGGNLKGIAKKLDYIKSLNVGVIYLNPIFKAYSNHRYDTADYKIIDELLGTEEDFKELCDQAHKLGIKIILDGVFSHTGSNSLYFDSEGVFGNGAVQNAESPYREWFDFKNYPDDYTSWWGIKTLPCVDENNESYRNYIIRDEDSVIAHWLNLGADGFRLDVADELPDSFIYELRNRMKAIKPDSLLIGEVWEDASNKCSYGVRRRYFTSGELDSVMNYPFKNAIVDYVCGNDNGQKFRNTVMTLVENYPTDVINCVMNIISTHDTVRILTVLGCDYVPQNKADRAAYRLSDSEMHKGISRLKAAVFLQFILPGMPSIYYGDEIGTQGFEDPFCRSYFDWSKTENNPSLDFYRELSGIKDSYFSLKEGSSAVSVERNGVIKLERSYSDEVLTAYVNISDEVFEIETDRKCLMAEETECYGNKKFTKKFGFILLS